MYQEDQLLLRLVKIQSLMQDRNYSLMNLPKKLVL